MLCWCISRIDRFEVVATDSIYPGQAMDNIPLYHLVVFFCRET